MVAVLRGPGMLELKMELNGKMMDLRSGGAMMMAPGGMRRPTTPNGLLHLRAHGMMAMAMTTT